MGAVIAKRLSLNHTKGPIFGGIYAARLAKHFEIPIRHDEKGETLLPLTFLDYRSMVAHEFIIDNDDKMLLYNLRFNKKHNETIILPAPSLFDLTVGHYLILSKAVYAHRGQTSAPKPEPNHHCTHIVRHVISGIRRRSPASGILMTLLSTPGRVATILGM